MIDHAEFILSKIDAGADDLEPVTVVQGNLRQWYDEILELRTALKASVDLQNHIPRCTCGSPLPSYCMACQRLWES